MQHRKEWLQASQIAFVYIVATSIFGILGKANDLITATGSYNSIVHFLKVTMFGYFVALLIALVLAVSIRKAEGRFAVSYLQKPELRITSGLLSASDGAIKLSGKIAVLIANQQTLSQTEAALGAEASKLMMHTVQLSLIPIGAVLFQILFGLYLILHKSRNNEELRNEK